MHRKQHARSFGHRRRDRRRVDVEGLGVAVDEHDLSAYFADGERSCDVAVGRKDDLVAGADTEREQSQPERLESTADTDCMRGTDIVCELVLEALYARAEDVLRGGRDLVERRIDLLGDRLVLRHEVDEGDRVDCGGSGVHGQDATRYEKCVATAAPSAIARIT